MDPGNSTNGPFASQAYTTAALGPILTGSLVNLIVAGFASGELTLYLRSTRYTTDSKRLKVLVWVVMSLAFVQSCFQGWIIWHYGLHQVRDANSLFAPTIIEKVATLPVGIEGALVQTYFCFRAGQLYKTKRNKLIYFAVCGTFILVGFVGSMLYLIFSLTIPAGTAQQELPLPLNISTALWVYGCAAADVTVSVCLVVILRSHMKGFRASTDSMLRQVCIYALASAAYTALFASIPGFLILIIAPNALVAGSCYAFLVPLSSLYALSLLLNLNSRETLLRAGKEPAPTQSYANIGRTTGTANNHYPHLVTAASSLPAHLRGGPPISPIISVSLEGESYDGYEAEHLRSMKLGFEGVAE